MITSTVRRIRRLVVGATATATVAGALLVAGPLPVASAALVSIQPPSGPSCDSSRAQLVVAPPRAYTGSGSDQVGWISEIQRWNPTRGTWYVYATYQNWGTFQSTGMSLTSWSVFPTVRGGMYVNNYMRYPVNHVGYYRIKSYVQGNKGGATWGGYISGGQYCYMS